MIRLAIVVEGPTEEAFVKQVLLNHLLLLGVAPTGPELASAIGLGKISTECPRFRQWLAHMESLGETSHKDDSSGQPGR